MSSDLNARLRALERQGQDKMLTPKLVLPLAGMSERWLEQYKKDPEVLSLIWDRTVKDYREQHAQEWREHPEHFTNFKGEPCTSKDIPPWGSLLITDERVENELHDKAETALIFWLTVGGGKKEVLQHDD